MQASAAAAVSLSLALSCLVQAQAGSNCSTAGQCAISPECSRGYCHCAEGYIQHDKNCLPERAFNETCTFDEQCVDFRLKCNQGLCACIKHYHWDEHARQCLTYKDLQYMLDDMQEKRHPFGRLIVESNLVFAGMMWAGLAVTIIGLVLASGCLFYGCCYGRWCSCKRDKLSRSPGTGEQTQRTQETTLAGSNTTARTQGTGVDYIPALYDTSSFDVV